MSSSSCGNSSGQSYDNELQASYQEEEEEKDDNGDVGAFDNESQEAALDSHQTAGPYLFIYLSIGFAVNKI